MTHDNAMVERVALVLSNVTADHEEAYGGAPSWQTLATAALDVAHHAELVRMAIEWRNDLFARGYSGADPEVARLETLLAKIGGDA